MAKIENFKFSYENSPNLVYTATKVVDNYLITWKWFDEEQSMIISENDMQSRLKSGAYKII